MKKILTILFGFLSCYAFCQTTTENSIPGKIIVKLTPVAYEQAIASQPKLQTRGITAGEPVSIGLAGVDNLNMRYKATTMRRLFPDAGKYEAKHRKYGLHLWYEITVDERENPETLSEEYKKDGNIEWAEPMPVIRSVHDDLPVVSTPAAEFPNDPEYSWQWHYENTGQIGGVAGMDIRLPGAWEVTKGDPRVIVAIVDKGVDFNHQDLKDNMWVNMAEKNGTPGVDDDDNGFIDDIHGFNFLAGGGLDPNRHPTGPAPIIPGDHGTHVAGTVAAATNNAIGVAGVAGGDGTNKGALLMSCQAIGDAPAYLSGAITYAADNGATILQNSWTMGTHSQQIREAINYFIQEAGKDEHGNPLPNTPMVGGIAIFAAGNSHTSEPAYPAFYEEVLTVAATNHYGTRASYSNYGNWVDISAPGGDTEEKLNGGVYSTLPNNLYGYMQGTSMACPHVSGVAALVLSIFGSETYTPSMLRDHLLSCVNPLPDEPLFADGYMGAGLIDASKAVKDFVHVTGVELPPAISLYLGRDTTITPTIAPPDATNKFVTWSSEDASIVGINTNGILTGTGLGTTTITVTTNNGSYTASSTVTVEPVLIDNITLPASITINKNRTQRIPLNIIPHDASDKRIIWESNAPAIVSVDENGVIEAIEIGATTITATSNEGNKTATCAVTVVQPVSGISLNQSTARLVSGNSITLTATVEPADAQDPSVRWNSSNTNTATVQDGIVSANRAGETTITATTNDGGFNAECLVTVTDNAQVPEGFSPNGDGINDFLTIAMDSRNSYVLRIFDRSGQVHYQSDDYKNDWDGAANKGPYKGEKVPPGTYFYTLTPQSGSAQSGYIVIRY